MDVFVENTKSYELSYKDIKLLTKFTFLRVLSDSNIFNKSPIKIEIKARLPSS